MKFKADILIDVLVVLALSLGVLHHDQHLLNIGYFAGWFFGVTGLLAYAYAHCQAALEKQYHHRHWLLRAYSVTADIAFVVFAAWMGWFALATVYVIQAALKAQFTEKQEDRLRRASVVE